MIKVRCVFNEPFIHAIHNADVNEVDPEGNLGQIGGWTGYNGSGFCSSSDNFKERSGNDDNTEISGIEEIITAR